MMFHMSFCRHERVMGESTHLSAMAASYMAAPSCPILAAYIQLTLALMSGSAVTAAHTRLVSASPSASRAIAAGLIKPCAIAHEVAQPQWWAMAESGWAMVTSNRLQSRGANLVE
jgi:hypothetical protein